MDNRGFTLLELLLALLAGTIVLAGIGSLFVYSQRVAYESEAQAFLQRQGALVMDEMTQRIRSASALSQGQCPLANPTPNSIYVTNTNFPPNNGPYCFHWSPNGGGQLLMDTTGGTWNLLSGTAAPLTATGFTTTLNDPGVTISFQLSDNRGNSMTFATNVARRNP